MRDSNIDWAKAKDIAEHKFVELCAKDPNQHTSFSGNEALAYAAKELKIDADVEGFCYEPDNQRTDGLSYINMGDTYDLTLLFCSEAEEFSIGSWGGFLEEREARLASDS